MFRPRLIPVLLLDGGALVKSRQFKDYRYIGDPINAVRVFNDLRADELIFLDISATRDNRSPSVDFIKCIGEEANMPFAVGGGISTLEDVRQLISAGAEKVVINTSALDDPDFIHAASKAYGASAIVVCIDVRTTADGGHRVCRKNGSELTGRSPTEFAKLVEEMGAGELLVQSVERDGMMGGYDISLIRSVSEAVAIPVISLGGAGSFQHLKEAYAEGYASALAAGSMFVFHGANSGVLINYPDRAEISFDDLRER